jgi:ATP-dependent Lon protease
MARVLVVDDDELLRGTIELMLRGGGHDVVLAAAGQDAIRQFQAQRFDLVVCDLFMPTKETGLETVAALRKLSATVPIVSMTGSIPRSSGGADLDPDYLRVTKEFGATRVIAKPFRASELLAVVRDCLDPSKAPAAA